MAGHGVKEDKFDHEKASFKLLDELVDGVSDDVVLENGETRFLVRQEQKKQSSDASPHS